MLSVKYSTYWAAYRIHFLLPCELKDVKKTYDEISFYFVSVVGHNFLVKPTNSTWPNMADRY